MFEYYFSKGFVVLECNSNKLNVIAKESTKIIHEMDMHDSDYVMTCTITFTFISNRLNMLLLQCNFPSSYIQTKYICVD